MDETRIKVLIEKHRQHLTRKVEETFSRAGKEWAAQAAELHILRADAENRRKEGRNFYKMDEANIQNLRADLTEDYHSLAKSHTVAIEQMLDDFNDDQMLFRLETEALERERLAAIPTSPPMATEQTEVPPNEEIMDTAQEELAPTNRPSEDTHTVPDPVEEEVNPLDPTPPPEVSAAPEADARANMTPLDQTQPPTTTVQPEQPATTPDPENILDILEEE